MSEGKTARLSVRIDENTQCELEMLATSWGLTTSEATRKAIEVAAVAVLAAELKRGQA